MAFTEETPILPNVICDTATEVTRIDIEPVATTIEKSDPDTVDVTEELPVTLPITFENALEIAAAREVPVVLVIIPTCPDATDTDEEDPIIVAIMLLILTPVAVDMPEDTPETDLLTTTDPVAREVDVLTPAAER